MPKRTISPGRSSDAANEVPRVFPFPLRDAGVAPSSKAGDKPGLKFLPQSADDVLATFDTMSRRINDLARELNCLGYFDNDDDRPRAA